MIIFVDFINRFIIFCNAMNIVNYGDKLRRIRKQKDLSQTQMADITGFSQSMISTFEKNTFPELEYVYKFCIYFNIPIWEFFDIDNDIEKKYNIPNELVGLCDKIKRLSHPLQAKFLLHMESGLDLIDPSVAAR